MSNDKNQFNNIENNIKEKKHPHLTRFDRIISDKTSNSQIEILLNNNKENENEEKIKDKILEEKIEERKSSISSLKSSIRNERLGFFYCLNAQFLWTLNSVYLKYLTLQYHSTFKNKTFLFERGIATMIIGFFLGNY